MGHTYRRAGRQAGADTRHPASTSASPSTSPARTAAAGSWCPSSRARRPWTSPDSSAAYEGLVEKARVNKLHARRLRRRHDVAHQPRRARHSRLGAASDGRPGQHHRGRLDRLPARVRHGDAAARGRAGHLEGDDGQQHLRSPGHPGRRVGGIPGHGGRTAAGRRRVLQRRGGFAWAWRWPRLAAGEAAQRSTRRVAARPAPRPSPPARCSTSPPAWRW